MVSYNKVIMAGNLTRDPEFRVLPSGTPLASFGLASSRRYRSREGEQREQTCFVDVKFFGRPAEVINEYMRKGRSILVEGRLDYSSWTAQDGSKRSKLEVVGEQFQFLGSGRQDRGDRSAEGGGHPERGGRRDEEGYGRQEAGPPRPAEGGGRPEERDEGYSQESGGGLDDVPF